MVDGSQFLIVPWLISLNLVNSQYKTQNDYFTSEIFNSWEIVHWHQAKSWLNKVIGNNKKHIYILISLRVSD